MPGAPADAHAGPPALVTLQLLAILHSPHLHMLVIAARSSQRAIWAEGNAHDWSAVPCELLEAHSPVRIPDPAAAAHGCSHLHVGCCISGDLSAPPASPHSNSSKRMLETTSSRWGWGQRPPRCTVPTAEGDSGPGCVVIGGGDEGVLTASCPRWRPAYAGDFPRVPLKGVQGLVPVCTPHLDQVVIAPSSQQEACTATACPVLRSGQQRRPHTAVGTVVLHEEYLAPHAYHT